MTESPHLLKSLQGLSATLVGMARTRLELIAIEWAEEKSRLFNLVLLGLAGLLCLAFGLLMFTFLVVLLFWDTPQRYLSIVLMGAAYLVAGAILLWRVRSQAVDPAVSFENTLAEIELDREMLDEVAKAREPRP